MTGSIRTGISSPTTGARGTFTVPSKTNKLAQRIETERSNAKGKRLYYVLIDLDNTNGSEQVRLDTIEFVDRDGRRIQSLDEQDVIERWHLSERLRGAPTADQAADRHGDLPGSG